MTSTKTVTTDLGMLGETKMEKIVTHSGSPKRRVRQVDQVQKSPRSVSSATSCSFTSSSDTSSVSSGESAANVLNEVGYPTSPEFFQRLNRIWAKEDARLEAQQDSFAWMLFWTPVLFAFRVVELCMWPLLTVSKVVTGQKPVSLWSVPLEERKKTMAIVLHYILFFCIPFGHVFGLFFLIFPLTTPMMLTYYLYIHKWDTSAEDGKRTPWLRYVGFWKYVVSYFPVRLVKTANLDPRKSYVFGYHPHGIISYGCVGNFATDSTGFSRLFPGINIRPMTLQQNFSSPFMREVLLSLGMCAASQKACQNILKTPGNAVCLVVGGAQEALDSEPGTYRFTLGRQGFVRQALMSDSDLVPVIGFGENDIYNLKYFPPGSFMRKVQEFLKKRMGFSMPIFTGRGVWGGVGILPKRKPIITIVGKPVKMPKLSPEMKKSLSTSPEGRRLVEECHQKYIEALKELWDSYKGKFAVNRQGTLVVKK